MSFVNYEGYTRAMAKASVGAGWAGLLDEIFDKFEDVTAIGRMGAAIVPTIIQVKEKFGGLRVYIDHTESEELFDFLYEVQERSFRVCEHCGASGALRKSGGLYFTACDVHSDNQPAIKPF